MASSQSSKASTSSVFPLEIIETIIDLLAEEYDCTFPQSNIHSSVILFSLDVKVKNISLTSEFTLKSMKRRLRVGALFPLQTDLPKYIGRLDYQLTSHDNRLFTVHQELLERMPFLQSLVLILDIPLIGSRWTLPMRSTLLKLMHLPTLTHLKPHRHRQFPCI